MQDRPGSNVDQFARTEYDLKPPVVAPRSLVAELGDGGPARDGVPTARRVLRSVITWTKRLALVGLVLAVAGLVGAFFVVRHYEAGLPSVAELRRGYRPAQVTRVLARDGTVLGELFTERRTVVPIAELPAHVKLAVLAAEDASFYEHEGLNYLGIVRAFLVNLKSGRTRQGGSTITQQVVKNLLLDSERTYARKIREALLARRLEQELQKDEILELYLNHIYFGHGRYGVEEAAKDLFGKSARELTVGEAALLAGLVAGPESFSPRRGVEKPLQRRTFVLGQMRLKHFLTDAQHDAAAAEALHLAPAVDADESVAPEAVAHARRVLFELEPERAPRGGFTLQTTIDPKLQVATRRAVRENLQAYDKRHGLVAPFRAPKVDPKTKKTVTSAPVPFEGTPSFTSHKVYVGVVVGSDDAAGTLEVRVGSLAGSVRLADYARYNPEKLPPSRFAEQGARLRVSLLAAPPEERAAAAAAGTGAFAPGAPPGSPGSAASAGGAAPPSAKAVAKLPLRLELGPESAAVVLDVRTREVLAVVGSYEGAQFALDRAFQARRQPGSTFKPVVYSYALHARRHTPATLVAVEPVAFAGGYKPANYEGWSQNDPLRLRVALQNSVNVAAVHVLEDVGPESVVEWAKALGIASPLKPDLSLALGSYEVRPIELAGAYATFAAGGTYDEPRLLTKITDGASADTALPAQPPGRRVLEPAEAYLTTSLLQSVVEGGTATRAKTLGRPLAGKTGTSNRAKDAWFAGYSPDVTAVVWVGYDDAQPLGKGEAGGQTALPAWIAIAKAALDGKPRADFPRPPGITAVQIDPRTGKRAPPGWETAIEELFLEGTEPTEVASPDDELGVDGGAATDGGAPRTLRDGGLPALPTDEDDE